MMTNNNTLKKNAERGVLFFAKICENYYTKSKVRTKGLYCKNRTNVRKSIEIITNYC